MDKKNHHDGFDGTIDSTDLATILRERKKAASGSYAGVWKRNRPRTWAEAVRSFFRHESSLHSKHH